jgi:multiple sugar transport system ATP-binding protein
VTPERRDVAMVFQSYGLYPSMSARDNIAFPLVLRRVPKQERAARVQAVAEMLGIVRTLDRQPRQLSGGERQRVALARAIVRDPRVFLLDEPISNLDAHLRASTREELKRIHARLKATFIYVTHDQDDAEAMGDRVVVLANGAVQQYDVPTTIYHRPQNRFVASFVGRLPMNFVEGGLTHDGGRVWFEAGELRLDIGPIGADLPASGRVLLGVRPEAIVATPADGEQAGPSGPITLTEVIAPDQYATVRVGNLSLRARMLEEAPLRVDDQARLTINRSRIHLFDVESGVRLEAVQATEPSRSFSPA